MPIEIKMEGQVAVVTLNEGENRLNLDFLSQVMKALDSVEKETEANVLVVNSAHDKIFSNGIDLEWLLPLLEKNDKATLKRFIETMMDMFKRVLLFPMPTIVAINGHAFAGGAIWSCYFDFRFMRSDRGYLCFPEVDLGIPFLPGMLAGMKKAIPRYKLEEMVITGKRLTATECEAHNIITKACPIENLMEETMGFAKTLNKKRSTVAAIKADLNKDVVYALEHEDPPIIDSGRFYV
ncbi:MAG: enoyl-CoA hydratase/isomerase family protein [Desulfobacterales bacterium]|nr:enoyl-CoA hydratase/isomerase family protein [Desulfobacterales bacterium]